MYSTYYRKIIVRMQLSNLKKDKLKVFIKTFSDIESNFSNFETININFARFKKIIEENEICKKEGK